MIRNDFIFALRNLKHAHSTINILGLAVGMACCILILQYVRYELGYESQHSKADRIYRVLRETQRTDGRSDFSWGTSGPLGPAMKAEISEVEEIARMWRHGPVGFRYGEQNIGLSLAVVDSTFFDVFDFDMVDHTNPKVALQQPMSILLTESTVKRLFGSENPIGKRVSAYDAIATGDYVVAGVLKDYEPNTALGFHLITTHFPSVKYPHIHWTRWLPGSWRKTETYALFHEEADTTGVEAKLYQMMEKNLGSEVSRTDCYRLQKLTRTRLYSETDFGVGIYSDRTIGQIYAYMTVAGLVILIACVNFVNLSTARSLRRSREVGIRKVVGAQRGQLIRQFMVEAMILALFAGILSLSLAQIVLPVFNQFLQLQLTLGVAVLPWVMGLTFLVGILAGSYPAFFLSRFQPVVTLKGNQGKSNVLRNSLVVFQFATSILLIIGSLTVYRQLDYVGNRDLGYTPNGLLSVSIFARKPDLRQTKASIDAVKAEFAQHPNIMSATTMTWQGLLNPEQITITPANKDTELSVYYVGTDLDFLDTYQVSLKAGRNLRKRTESGREFLINESAAQILRLENPVGQELKITGENAQIGTIVGVMEDFHFQSLHNPIRPLLIDNGRADQIHLRIRSTNIDETLAFCKKVWEKFAWEAPFAYQFLDERLANAYRSERQTATLSFVCAGLAIFIACLGLLGLAAFAAERRAKEIAIRKVLGASVASIFNLLSNEFLKLIVLANLIAWPVAYLLTRQWLDSFAYRIDINIVTFLSGGFLCVLLALATVFYQTIKVAMTNPVEALHDE